MEGHWLGRICAKVEEAILAYHRDQALKVLNGLDGNFMAATTLDKKKNHPRDSRREERCSTCDIMLDQARSAQGKSRGQSWIGLALR